MSDKAMLLKDTYSYRRALDNMYKLDTVWEDAFSISLNKVKFKQVSEILRAFYEFNINILVGFF